MFVTESDPRVWDAVQRWFRMPKLELWAPSPCFKFIVSPEGDAGVLVEIREERRFACINTEPNLGYCSIPRRLQPPSTAPDVAVVFGTVRYPLTYFGDDRIIGALKTESSVLLLVNLGIQVALVILALTDPSNFRVVWTGIGSQVPELDQNLQPVARAASPPNLQPVARIGSVLLAPPAPPPSAPVQVSSAASLPHDSGATPRVGPTTPGSTPPADEASPGGPSTTDMHPPAALSGSPPPSATRPSPAPVPTDADPQRSRVVPPTDGPRATTVSPPPDTGPTAKPGPPDLSRASATTPAADGVAERSGPATAVLSPIVLSEEVTAVLVRHLRHAATLLPIAKGAEVARQWLLAFERACRDMSGIGDVVGGSGVLFAALHEGGHLAVMPSVVSASAAAKLLVAVTPLVVQVSRRRWALRASALCDPQSVIFRKLARRAPATCRLATNAPPAPAPTGRVLRPGAVRPEGKPTRKNRTVELAAQLAAANAELERLRADVAELRRAVVSPGRDPAAATSTGTALDDEAST